MSAVAKRRGHPDLSGKCDECGEHTEYWACDDGPAYHYWQMVPGDIVSARPVLICPACMTRLRREWAKARK